MCVLGLHESGTRLSEMRITYEPRRSNWTSAWVGFLLYALPGAGRKVTGTRVLPEGPLMLIGRLDARLKKKTNAKPTSPVSSSSFPARHPTSCHQESPPTMAAGQKLYPRATVKKIVKAHSKRNVSKNVDVLVDFPTRLPVQQLIGPCRYSSIMRSSYRRRRARQNTTHRGQKK